MRLSHSRFGTENQTKQKKNNAKKPYSINLRNNNENVAEKGT